MKTVLMVKAALLALPIYALGAWYGMPFEAAVAGLLYALAWAAFRHRGALPPVFEAAQILGLGAVAVAGLTGPQAISANPTAVVLGCLSLGAWASLLIGRPWTAEFSASEYKGAERSALFVSINRLLSGLWAALFGWLAVAAVLHLPAWAHWVPVVFGGIASALLPKYLVTRGLSRMAAGDQRNAWPAPDFAKVSQSGPAQDDACDVAVVGAGMGGLTAAALLADSGLKVHVYEHHVVPGGFAHTWVRRARGRDEASGDKLVFRFDSGVHDVSGWQPGGPVRSVFERLGIAGDTEWARLDHRYHLDGKTLDVPRDWRAYAAKLGDMYPEEAAGIRALFEDIHAVFEGMYSTARERGGIPGTPASPQALLAFARNHPLAVEWMNRPWEEFVARHVTGAGPKRWISALTGYITDDARAITVADMVPIYGYYFNGGFYPKGGSGAIADSLAAAIEKRGGAVHLRTPVRRIVTEGGVAKGLVVADVRGRERRVQAKAVVCNADLSLMLTQLLDDPAMVAKMRAQLGPTQAACSAVAVHLGIRGKLDLPHVVHVTTPDGVAGLVIPSVLDSSAAPEGYSTVEIMELISSEDAQTWFPAGAAQDREKLDAYRHSEAYLARKKAACDRLIARAQSVIPDLEQRIVCRSDATPLTYERYDWTQHGSIYGTRAAARPAVKTPVQNLVLAGAATHGAGIEAVVISGALAAEALVPGLLARGTPAAEIAAEPRPANVVPLERLAG